MLIAFANSKFWSSICLGKASHKLTMPKQVCKFVEAVVGADQVLHLATHKLLNVICLTGSPHTLIVPLQASLLPPPGCDGQRHVENAKGDPKGSKDGEKTELNGDPLGTIMSVPTCRSKEAAKSLFFRHSARHLASVSKGYQDQAKDRERLRVPYGQKSD